jgi:hypothetical protein
MRYLGIGSLEKSVRMLFYGLPAGYRQVICSSAISSNPFNLPDINNAIRVIHAIIDNQVLMETDVDIELQVRQFNVRFTSVEGNPCQCFDDLPQSCCEFGSSSGTS